LLEQLLLLLLVLFVAFHFLLSQLLFPFFSFFLSAISARQSLKLLGIGDLELVTILVALKGNLLAEQASDHSNVMLTGCCDAIAIEGLAFVAPTTVLVQ
jgi:hypothetical protein